MNILFWTELFAPSIGGIEIQVAHLSAELVRRGHGCGVVTDAFAAGLAAEDTLGGVSVYRLAIRKALGSRDIRQIRRVVEDASALRHAFRPDVEEVFIFGPSFIVQQLSNRAACVPTIASIQMDFATMMRGAEIGRFLGDCVRIVAVSDFVRESVHRANPAIAGKIDVITNCLPPPRLAPAPLPLDPPTLLCAGRFIAEKGFDVALQAFARVCNTHDSVRLVMAGDGPERSALQMLSRELGIASRVDFLGWTAPDRIAAEINRATLMITPSRWQEAFGLVNLEAAQMGRPVVATRVGGIPEIVDHDWTGLLVENGNVDAMACAVSSLLDDPARLMRMGDAARERARDRFDFSGYSDRYETLLQGHARRPQP
jgi:glycogen(starch) synthase